MIKSVMMILVRKMLILKMMSTLSPCLIDGDNDYDCGDGFADADLNSAQPHPLYQTGLIEGAREISLVAKNLGFSPSRHHYHHNRHHYHQYHNRQYQHHHYHNHYHHHPYHHYIYQACLIKDNAWFQEPFHLHHHHYHHQLLVTNTI